MNLRLTFDRGTALIHGGAPDILQDLPGVLWDPRVQRWRTPAFRATAVAEALHRRGHTVARPLPPPPPPMPAPALRAYQAAALAAWHAAGDRGVVVLPTGAGKTRLAIAAIAAAGVASLVLV